MLLISPLLVLADRNQVAKVVDNRTEHRLVLAVKAWTNLKKTWPAVHVTKLRTGSFNTPRDAYPYSMDINESLINNLGRPEQLPFHPSMANPNRWTGPRRLESHADEVRPLYWQLHEHAPSVPRTAAGLSPRYACGRLVESTILMRCGIRIWQQGLVGRSCRGALSPSGGRLPARFAAS